MDMMMFYAFIATMLLLSTACMFAIYAILRYISDMILVIKEIKKEERKNANNKDRNL